MIEQLVDRFIGTVSLDQVGIAILGVTAAFLSFRGNERLRRYACLLGLSGQPLWLYATITAKQWGMVANAVIYTLIYAEATWRFWIRRR